jgi:hypothetical protein
MDWLPIALGVTLVSLAAAFALLPLVRGAPASDSASQSQAGERVELYRQVLELEFDVKVGKLSADEARELSSQLLAQAGESLREERAGLAELDDEIEREIAAARAAFAAARTARPQRPAGTPT